MISLPAPYFVRVIIEGEKRTLGSFACDIDAALAVNTAFMEAGLPPPNVIPSEFLEDLAAIAQGTRDAEFIATALNRRLVRTFFIVPRRVNPFIIDLGKIKLQLKTTRFNKESKVGNIILDLIDLERGERSALLEGYQITLRKDGALFAQEEIVLEVPEIFPRLPYGVYTLELTKSLRR